MRRAVSESEPDAFPAELDAVFDALESAAIIAEGSRVLLSNDAAIALRLVWEKHLTSKELSLLAEESRARGQRISRELAIPWGDATRAVHAVAVPIPSSKRVVLLVTDIEESRRVEAVRRDFIANVSHELKTPVGAMLLLAEAIRDARDDPETLERFTERLHQEATRYRGS